MNDDSRRPRRRTALWATTAVLVLGVGALVVRELSPPATGTAGPSVTATQLASLDDDADQQSIASRLSADIAALPSPAPAARVGATCDLAGQVTRPLATAVDRWIIANCTDGEPRDGARYDVGPLDRD